MSEATGTRSASVTIGTHPETATAAPQPQPQQGQPDSYTWNQFPTIPGPEVYAVELPSASWLGAVQRRLNSSIGIEGAINDGRWLARDVVAAANTFFDATSTLLPSEPYLYSSLDGNLVAEFDSNVGRMTLVVSKDAAVALATVGNATIQKKIDLVGATTARLRHDISGITEQLRTRTHGSVGPKR